MTTPTLEVLGRRVRPLEPVPVVGELLGLNRGQAFRAADSWPCTGSKGSRRVIVPRLLDELGIPYTVEEARDD